MLAGFCWVGGGFTGTTSVAMGGSGAALLKFFMFSQWCGVCPKPLHLEQIGGASSGLILNTCSSDP